MATFPENEPEERKSWRLLGVTTPWTVMIVQPLNPPVAGPNMLHTNVPPSASAEKPKSDGDGIVFPSRFRMIRPVPTTCGGRRAVATAGVAATPAAPAATPTFRRNVRRVMGAYVLVIGTAPRSKLANKYSVSRLVMYYRGAVSVNEFRRRESDLGPARAPPARRSPRSATSGSLDTTSVA